MDNTEHIFTTGILYCKRNSKAGTVEVRVRASDAIVLILTANAAEEIGDHLSYTAMTLRNEVAV